jgi:hypothetical protein
MNIGDILGKFDIGILLDKLIPYMGDLSPEEKRKYILLILEAVARGFGEGFGKSKTPNQ